MEFKIYGIYNNKEIIELPQPIWFCHTIDNNGTNICFDFTFLKKISTNIVRAKVNWKIKESKHEEIFLVDEIKKTQSSKDQFFHLKLSHPICYIWQNNVEPQNFTNFSSNDLYDNFCKPFGININQKLKNFQISNFFTTLGMTYWDAISIFFKKTIRSEIFLNEDKHLTLKTKANNPNILNENWQHVTLYEKTEDRTKLLSKIMVHQTDDEPNKFTISDNVNQICINKGIERTKFFNLPKQYSLLPNRGTQMIIDKHNAQHKTVEIHLAKIIKPIYPGSIINLAENETTPAVQLCVNSFQTSTTRQGQLTKIVLLYNDLVS